MSPDKIFDITATLIIIVLGFAGYYRGVISAVISFIGISLGTYFAWRFTEEWNILFLEFFPNVDKSIASIAVMCIILLCIGLFIALISMIIYSLMRLARISGVNHVGGMFIGLTTGFVVIIVFCYVIMYFTSESELHWMKHSTFMFLAEQSKAYVYEFIKSCGFDIVILKPNSLSVLEIIQCPPQW